MSSEVQPKCTDSSWRGRRPGVLEALAHVILDRLDVVIDSFLDGLDRIGRRRRWDRLVSRFTILCKRPAMLCSAGMLRCRAAATTSLRHARADESARLRCRARAVPGACAA